MNSIVSPTVLPEAAGPSRTRLDHKKLKGTRAIFALLLLLGRPGYTAWSMSTDDGGSNETLTTVWPIIRLGLALAIALGFWLFAKIF